MASHPCPASDAVLPATRFTDPTAVEAWDAWFRWRADGALRDVTIDATWRRVADAVAAAEGDQAALWAHRFADAFSHWRLLPDERLLQVAGTNAPLTACIAPVAVVNAGAFVDATLGCVPPRFDRERFVEAAALAVRLLDDACASLEAGRPAELRLGLIGLGDSLRLLGIPYASAEAAAHARVLAAALAEGGLRGAVELAMERGAAAPPPAAAIARWRARGLPEWLVEQAVRHGVHCKVRVAIESQPRLARLANGASDALEPAAADLAAAHDRDALRAAGQVLHEAMRPWLDTAADPATDAAGEGPAAPVASVP